jgi:hypothetical protein
MSASAAHRRGNWATIRSGLHLAGLTVGGLLLLQQVGLAYRAFRLSQVALSRPAFLVVALAAALGATGVQIAGWRVVMARLGVPLAWRPAFAGYSLSFLPRYIPGTVWGYLSRNEWLLRYRRVAYGISNTGSFFEVFFILFAGGLTGLAYSITLAGSRAAFLAASAVLLMLLVGTSLKWLPGVLAQLPQRLNVRAITLPTITSGQFVLLVLIYIVLWLCHGLMLASILRTLGYTEMGPLLLYSVSYYVAWTVGFLVLFVPSGFGIRENILSILLVTVVGIRPADAIVVAVLARLVSLFGELIWVVAGVAMTQFLRYLPESATNTE